MTMKMMMNESKTLGEFKRLVSQIRKIDINDIEMASKFLRVDKEYILYVQDVIKDHPEMDDEEIAEIIIDY